MSKKGYKQTEEHKKKRSNVMKGRSFSEKHRKKLSEARVGRFHKEESQCWKGENIKISMKHKRIEQELGKPRYCEICKSTKKKTYHWSNKDHKYSLKKEDWQRLCVSCHHIYDLKIFGTSIKTLQRFKDMIGKKRGPYNKRLK